MLAERWMWHRNAVVRYLKFILENGLFFTKLDTKNGRWLRPVDAPLCPPLCHEPCPQNQTPEWVFVFKNIPSLATKDPNKDLLDRLLEGNLIILPRQLDTERVKAKLRKFIDYRRTVLKKPIRTEGPLKVVLREFVSTSESHLCDAIDFVIEHEYVSPKRSMVEPQNYRGRARGEAAFSQNLALVRKYEEGGE
jgi:hypothetical protein